MWLFGKKARKAAAALVLLKRIAKADLTQEDGLQRGYETRRCILCESRIDGPDPESHSKGCLWEAACDLLGIELPRGARFRHCGVEFHHCDCNCDRRAGDR